MIALLWLVLAILSSPFKLKWRLEAENAALRHELTVVCTKKLIQPRLQLLGVKFPVHSPKFLVPSK